MIFFFWSFIIIFDFFSYIPKWNQFSFIYLNGKLFIIWFDLAFIVFFQFYWCNSFHWKVDRLRMRWTLCGTKHSILWFFQWLVSLKPCFEFHSLLLVKCIWQTTIITFSFFVFSLNKFGCNASLFIWLNRMDCCYYSIQFDFLMWVYMCVRNSAIELLKEKIDGRHISWILMW